EIRRRFLEFFRANGHEVVRSSSLVPRDDPSLLFTNSGMVQFKKIFQGQETRPYSRATTAQKCLRVGGKHNDLENVGRTARHHTFFEMLGNFSFGDYFKEQAIRFAWDFITKELGLPEDKLYATVYLDDDEAAELWLRHTGIPAERILRMDEKDNFWRMGDTGPCGPCSEILIDQGEHMSCGPDCGIGQCDCDRFLEIWNLVFMQFNEIAPGKREPLPKPSIDTGMGLERIAAVCQGVFSNYDTDLFTSIIGKACQLAGVSYSKSAPDTNEVDTALRVIADHSRSMAFMIADGIMPANEGRGYVLRRLIRRAYRFGRLIGMPSTFLHITADSVVDNMGEDFPELAASREFMRRVIREEEERFEKTLDKGLTLLEEELATLAEQASLRIPGDVAFKLYDTYGFPLDIINDVSEKRGFSVDEEGFREHMRAQKERAKAAWKGSGEVDIAARFTALLEEGLRSAFTGYDRLDDESRIIALLDSEGERVHSLSKGASGYCVTGITPFYGASGGQSGDTGSLRTQLGKAEVIDTLKPLPELTVHHISVSSGEILLDAEAALQVSEGSRMASARNHTCTHLLHAALREVLGEHARQAGSLVSPARLRFDFTHVSAMSPEEIEAVERKVNAAIMADRPLQVAECRYDEAIAAGAVALFGEKYADTVRVVSIENESTELCGGTHLDSTGQAGFFTILSETGIAAGVRRIEAATGWNALALFNERKKEAEELAALLKSKPGELARKVAALQADLRAARKDLEKISAHAASDVGKNLMDGLETLGGVAVLTARTGAPNIKALRELADDLRSKLPSGVICITSEEEGGKVSMIVAVTQDLHARFSAPDLIRSVAAHIGGSGGGRPDLAQAGGSKPAGIDAAFAAIKDKVRAG
ncbi:alanine--tRNA ligase, partial [Desulfovibrio sp. OttesenSCG-928-A18]|nr:alanine--tRNA ligase [Desulfovibrio sp. OttesenSCG-928-A18]